MKKTFKTNGRLLSQVFSSYNTTFDALCELINNSIQAKSTTIEIEVDLVDDNEGPSPFAFTEYRIIDNGDGVSISEFDRKILEIATDVKESKGIGRFAAFQIGSIVTINTTAIDNRTQKYTNTSVTLDAKSFTKSDIGECNFEVITKELEKKQENTFYKVSIKEFWDITEIEKYPRKKLILKLIPGHLEEAIFLKYSSFIVTEKISFFSNRKKISKDDFLVGKIENDDFDYNFSDGTIEKVALEYLNFKSTKRRIILAYRIDNNGIKTTGFEESITLDYPDNNSWVIYIDCNYFDKNTDTFRNLFLDGLDENIENLKKQIKNTIRVFIRDKYKDYSIFIDKLKIDKYYPYKNGSPSSSIEITFNQLAYYIKENYSILKNNTDTRKIIYPLLDRAMGNGDILDILENILSLDAQIINQFKKLLEKSNLSDIIKFTTELIKKQNFLDMLYEIIYGDISKYIKERSQLHKIIEKHLWIFGEEYSDAPVMFSDKSLKNSLDKLKNTYFDYEPTKADDNLIDIQNKEILDITDLLIYNDKKLSNGKNEILIVELKAPKVKISQKELNQVIRYKYDIETLGEFSKQNTSYKIILVSSDITPIAKSQIGNTNKRFPTLFQESNAGYNIEVYVMNWSDIITDRRQHLNYLGNYLATKEIDIQNELKTDYPELDISNLPIPTKKRKEIGKPMSTNVSKQKRKDLTDKIKAIHKYIATAKQDENTRNFLIWLSEIEKEINTKKFGLVFEEHREAIDDTLETHTPVLTENKKLFIDNGGQVNFLIEGDNLAALQLLLKTHKGKIDVIYIDPPYNTGAKDWKYDNDYVDKNDTFRHSKWLSMMKKRLVIAKKLLSVRGAFICAIDENELYSVGLLLEEIFGEAYEIHCIVVVHNPNGTQGKNFSYANEFALFILPKGEKIIGLQNRMNNPDIRPLRDVSTGNHLRTDAKNCFYPIFVKDKNIVGFGDVCNDSFHPESANIKRKDGVIEIYPIDPSGNERKWVFARQTVETIKDELNVVHNKNRNILDIVRHKTMFTYKTIWTDKEYNSNIFGTKLLKEIIPNCTFNFPKSLFTVKDCINAILTKSKNPIILDFFAGSGTTGHAVLEINKSGGKHRFILCTNNENSICRDVTYERIKRVIKNEKYPASLKYYKIDYIPISDKIYYEYADELLEHIRELVELENAINFIENDKIAIVLTDEEMSDFVINIKKHKNCRKLYRAHNVLVSGKQKEALRNAKIKVNVIPDYYYGELET